jgi:hypothetical protein
LHTNTSEHGQHLQNSAKATEGLSKDIQGKYNNNHGKKPDDIAGSIAYHISLFQGRQGHWDKQKITMFICHSTSVLFYTIKIHSRKIYSPVQSHSCALDSVFPNSL